MREGEREGEKEGERGRGREREGEREREVLLFLQRTSVGTVAVYVTLTARPKYPSTVDINTTSLRER